MKLKDTVEMMNSELDKNHESNNKVEQILEEEENKINTDVSIIIEPTNKSDTVVISDILKKSILFASILMTVTSLWQLMELMFYNSIQPSGVDTIIALILSASLYNNVERIQ